MKQSSWIISVGIFLSLSLTHPHTPTQRPRGGEGALVPAVTWSRRRGSRSSPLSYYWWTCLCKVTPAMLTWDLPPDSWGVGVWGSGRGGGRLTTCPRRSRLITCQRDLSADSEAPQQRERSGSGGHVVQEKGGRKSAIPPAVPAVIHCYLKSRARI